MALRVLQTETVSFNLQKILTKYLHISAYRVILCFTFILKKATGNSPVPFVKIESFRIHLVFCFTFVFISDLTLFILDCDALGLVDSVTNLNIGSQMCRTFIEIITCSSISS